MRTDSTKNSSTHLSEDDAVDLDHGGTGRVLRRRLKLRHIVFLGLAYMAPLAVFDTFGIVAEATAGRVPLAYILILIAVAITAFSYAKMSRYYPKAGSAYTYARETINPHVGFMVGWAATLDYLLLPMLNALLAAIYMGAVLPAVPAWVWVLSTIVICTVLNVVGVKLAAQVNVILVVVQIVVAVAFLFFAIRNIAAGIDGATVSLLPFDPSGVPTGALLGGASLLALSFLGFDAVTTMSEEAIHPKTDIPRAIMIIVVAAGVFFIAITYTMQVLFPDVAEVGDIVGASPEIAKYIGGALFQALFVGGYMFAVLGCGLTQQMSAARLLYAMGRDGTLPKRMFGRVNARTGVPIINVVFIAVLACSALFLDLASAASLINFGAYIAFGAVNLSLIFATVKYLRPAGRIGVFAGIVLPGLGLIINFALWLSLDANAKIVGLVWAVAGLVFLLVRTRMFREPAPAMAEPDMD
ncbi:APC family permease [Brevibacterium sp.]|uniref:APC family permease n=1 Tax=Brevibacterium sp. TaxID=1701 RepID=UPI002810A9AE|nr:APC family permease [Brevibacterium sp.]